MPNISEVYTIVLNEAELSTVLDALSEAAERIRANGGQTPELNALMDRIDPHVSYED